MDGLQSSRRLLVIVLMAVIFTLAAQPITDPDFWWHLKTGQYIVETRSIPHTDIFSSLRFGSEWVTHEWLSEVLIYSVFRTLSYGGLIVVFSILITVAFWIVSQQCRNRGAHPYVAGFALLLGAASTMPTWGVRPQMLSLLFASIFISFLDRYSRREKMPSIWWLVPLMILWVNLHAGFALGLALVLLKSPDFHQPIFQALVLLLLATFSALALSNRRARPGQLLLLVATAWATLRSGRNVAFFALVAMPLLAEHSMAFIANHRWGRWLCASEETRSGEKTGLKFVLNFFLLIIVLVIVVWGVSRAVANQRVSEAQKFPAVAVDFILAQRPPQPIYNEYAWGGYLIWRLYPDYRVYIDGRADVYGGDLMKEFLAVNDGNRTWREPLDNHNIRTVLVKPDVALASLLRQDSGWQKVFEDKQAIIFVRR